MKTHVASVITSTTTAAAIFRFTHRLERLRNAFYLQAALASGLVLAGTLRADQTASLAWNPVINTPVAGYALYVGNLSGSYTSRIDVGTNTQVTITGLKEGKTNYFAVTAYNSARIESPISSAVPYIVPGLLLFAPPHGAVTGGTISFPVAAGHSYELQASTNLSKWTNLWQTAVWSSNAWEEYEDWNSSSYPRRFYRLIMQ